MPTGASGRAFLQDVEIGAELHELKPAPSVDVLPFDVSFDKLTDRSFELLLYSLYKAGGSFAAKLQYDSVQLLPRGTDRGRDVVLLADQRPVAVVQCKKHGSALALPETLREVSRLILAAMVDPAVVPLQSGLTYILAASGGLSEPAQALFHETGRIVKEEESLIRECALQTRKKYTSLHGLDETAAADGVVAALRSASLHYLASEDLDAWLKEQPSVYAKFFAVRTVVETLWAERQFAALASEFRRGSVARKGSSLGGWYHASATASFSVVARAPGNSGGPPILLDDVYVPRKLEGVVEEWLGKAGASAEGVMVVIIAPGGYGKTSLLWHYHRKHNAMPGGHALLFSASMIETKVDRGDFDEDLTALVEHVSARTAEGARVAVCLDTFDVLAHREDLQLAGLRLVSELIAAGASVVMSSRPEEVSRVPVEQLAAIAVRLYLSEYDEEEFALAISGHCRAFYRHTDMTSTQVEQQIQRIQNLVALGRPVKEVCLNPLTLRMLFELYAPNQVPEGINSLRLYSEYWTARVRGDRRMAGPLAAPNADVSASVLRIAAKMLDHGTPLLSADQLADELATGRLLEHDVAELLNRNLLIRSGTGSLEFFHQTFFEHAAARHLDDIGYVPLHHFVTQVREVANDAFRLPVYEQLLLLLAGRAGNTPTIEQQIDALLNESHPGLQGIGLHAHMLATNGYEVGRRFMAKAAREKTVYLLTRFCQLIYNLQRQRVSEVVALIETAWDSQHWRSMELVARMLVWLAQSDWPVCKNQLEKHDFVKALHDCTPNDYVDVERLVVSVYRHGVPDDAEWSCNQMLRCVRNGRHARLVLEFVSAEVHRLPRQVAKEIQHIVIDRARQAPNSRHGPVPDVQSRCLSDIWRAHPEIAPTDENALLQHDAAEARLMLRALAITQTPTTQSLKLALINRAERESDASRLYILMYEFIAPSMAEGPAVGEAVWKSMTRAGERLLRSALIAPDAAGPCARVVSNAIKDLYVRDIDAPGLWEIIRQISADDWLQAVNYLPLFPVAVADGAPAALLALDLVCGDPHTCRRHASILKGALPSFSVTARRFGVVLKLAAATTDSRLLMTYFQKVESSGAWSDLLTLVTQELSTVDQIIRGALTSRVGSVRMSAFQLLAFLARRKAMSAPSHSTVLRWLNDEQQPEVRAAALPLLVTATDTSTVDSTVAALLRSANYGKPSSSNGVVEQLREVLTIPAIRLPRSLQKAILTFALRNNATEPQVSIVGRVIDLSIGVDDLDAAQDAALLLLQSETAQNLSATQKRSLGHHLDKPFLSLYRRLTVTELWRHCASLKQLDEHLGRLVVVSLCKSERHDIDDFLNSILDDVEVHPRLKRIIQDYRQFLWRR
ncbi:restriction endonuclease [Paraburkholderia graminis]|uniref:restriction endonuclease n=1 Tax=Paraburkholderia graminis TaxID=60548 RepID=UPI003CA3E26F